MLGVIDTLAPPKRDIYQRARLFDPHSFTHHAKFNLNLVQALIDRYSDPGDLVVDPMGGSGSILIATQTGRQVICGDIEAQWSRLQRDNSRLLSERSLFSAFNSGLACQWDAAKLPFRSGAVNLIVTSPPYFDTFSDWDSKSRGFIDDVQLNENGIAYGIHPRQIANLHIYEDYLRAMLAIYREVKRILRPVPGSHLVLVVKDVIRGGRIVPIVEDNISVALAAGFNLVDRLDVPTRGTLFRNVNKAKLGQNAPDIEPVLVFVLRGPQPKRRLALLDLPRSGDGPGWVIAAKAYYHARERGNEIWGRSPGENSFHLVTSVPGDEKSFHLTSGENGFDPARQAQTHFKARIRKETAFRWVRELAAKLHLGAGDEIAFYGGERYGQYICRRLETLGCSVTKPLEGLNNGQRLRWLTINTNGGDLCKATR